MDLSHEVRGSGRTRRAGLAAVVLGGAIGVGSMSGCGAALIAGAGYLAAEEVGQSNVEAARIIAGNNGQKRQTESKSVEQMAFESWMRQQSQEPEVFACNSIDLSLDGDSNSLSKIDLVGLRTTYPIVFRTDESICVGGMVVSDYRGRTSKIRVIDGQGNIAYEQSYLITDPEGTAHMALCKPGEVSRGHYKLLWTLDNSLVGSLDFEVRDASSVLTQK